MTMSQRSSLQLCLLVAVLAGMGFLACQAARFQTPRGRALQEREEGRIAWIAASTDPGPEYRAESEDDDDERYPQAPKQQYSSHEQHGEEHPKGYVPSYEAPHHKEEYYGGKEQQHGSYGEEEHNKGYGEEEHHKGYGKPGYGEEEHNKGYYKEHDDDKPQGYYDDEEHPHTHKEQDEKEHEYYSSKGDEEHKEEYPSYHGSSKDEHDEGGDEYHHDEHDHDHKGDESDEYHKEKEEGPYDDDHHHHEEEEKEEHHKDGYGGDDDHKPDGDGFKPPHEEEHYDNDKDDVVGIGKICLRESTRLAPAFRATNYVSQFTCCTPEDAPGYCLSSNSTDPDGYSYSKAPRSYRKGHAGGGGFIGDVVNPTVAAICKWEFTPDLCPPHLLKTCLGPYVLNCTLSTYAQECGSPFETLSFAAQGWLLGCDAQSCEAYTPGDKNRLVATHSPATTGATTLLTGTAWIFEGRISSVITPAGYKDDIKGDVTFVTEFDPARRVAPLGGGRLLAEVAGQRGSVVTPPAAKPAAAAIPAPAPAPAAAKQAAAPQQPSKPSTAAATKPTVPPQTFSTTLTPKSATKKQGASAGMMFMEPAPLMEKKVISGPSVVQKGVPTKAAIKFNVGSGGNSTTIPAYPEDVDLPVVVGGSLKISLYRKKY